MSEASRLRGVADHLRGRAATAVLEPMRAQLLALADYYDGMAEDVEQPTATAPVSARHG